MHVTKQQQGGGRVLTVCINEPELGGERLDSLQALLEGEGGGQHTDVVFRFEGEATPVQGGFARWEELVAAISRLKAKTYAAYHGTVGAAAVQVGLVVDVRLAVEGSRLRPGSLARGHFPGTSAYWLPKFVGLGTARRLLLGGEALDAAEAARLGLVDAVGPDLSVLITQAVERLRPIPPEAACFARRILDDCYRQERAATLEQLKAARYQVLRKDTAT
jgi:enoyl-CoA hydratase/carnithine racemase